MTLKPFSLFLLSPFQSPYENLELKKPCSLILLIKKEEENISVSSFLRVNGKSDNKNKESRQIIGWRDDNDDYRYVVAPFFLLPAAMLPGGVFPTSFVAFSSLVYNDSSRRNTSRVCVGTVLYELRLVYSLSSPIQPPTEILLNSSSLSPPSPACRAVSCLRPSSVFFSFRAREA